MSKQEDGMAAKVRGLEDRVTVLEAKAGVFASPTGAEVLAAKNAAKAKRIAAEQAAQDAADKKAAADKVKLRGAGAKALALVAILFGLCFTAQAENRDTWSLYSGSDNLIVPGTLVVTGATTIVGTLTSGATNLTALNNFAVGGNLTVTSNVVVQINATVTGTLAQVGVATFTAESVHNLGIDADYITTDAGAGIDTKSAGTLMVGAATANKIEISVTAVETEIQGTLDVIEAADFDAAVTMGTTLAVAGAGHIAQQTVVREVTATRVCTSADYGKLIILATNAAIAVTLPANGAAAGSTIDFMVGGQSGIAESDSCVPTIAAATADTLRTINSVDSDSVTYGTGHRIGARCRATSDGFFWTVVNLCDNTMSVNDSD